MNVTTVTLQNVLFAWPGAACARARAPSRPACVLRVPDARATAELAVTPNRTLRSQGGIVSAQEGPSKESRGAGRGSARDGTEAVASKQLQG